ncbi:MAG: MGMT family protein [Gammaproteobacteria bacterium]|nr:MGMT family protein [Gammaproteobacteria bacterium]
MATRNENHARIWKVIAQIPRGRVSTYGRVAERAGFPRGARLTAQALRAVPKNLQLPWHRVLNAQGRIAIPDGSPSRMRQRELLEREGVTFVGGRVNLERFGWQTSLDAMLWRPDD